MLTTQLSPVELQKVNSAYEEKLKASRVQEQAMFSLSWDIEELKWLTVKGVACALKCQQPLMFAALVLPSNTISRESW